MNEKTNSGLTVGFGISFAIANIVNVLMVIAKEANPSILAAMKQATGHHWITHAIIVIGVFGAARGALSMLKSVKNIAPGRILYFVPATAIISTIIIAGFYAAGLND